MENAIAAAMSRQLEAFAARTAQGMPRLGWKIGINVPEVQRRLGLTHALVGFLDGDRLFEDAATIAMPESARLHAEPELCLQLAHAPGSNPTLEQARAAIASVQPAIEIVDYALPATGLNAIITHSMFHHATVLGAARPVPSTEALERARQALVFDVADTSVTASRADLVPGDLGELVLLVTRLLAERGEALQAGDRIMSGAFVEKAIALVPGREVRASFGALGAVSCSGAGLA